MFTLAHLSDVHLGPLPAAERWSDYLGKRAIGALSWRFRRAKIHDPAVALALAADIKAHAPDHVAFTGDLANIALGREFVSGARWLKEFGPASWISFVPGNHDAYVRYPWEKGLGLWADYMTGDLRMPGERLSAENAAVFPFVRQRRNVALVGVSSALPQAWHRAGGELGARQLGHLAANLKLLGERGFYRILTIHHPPLPGMASGRKALKDAPALKSVLAENGVELVLFGHNHRFIHERLETREGLAHAIGVPSASARGGDRHPAAGWMLYRIARKDGAWRAEAVPRRYDGVSGGFVEDSPLELDHRASGG